MAASGQPGGIRQSIRRKILLMVAATTLVALVVAGFFMVAYDLRVYEETWAEDLSTQAEILGRASASALAFDDRAVAAENLSLLSVRPKILAGAVYTAKGALFASYAREDAGGRRPPDAPGAVGVSREGGDIVVFRRIVDRNEAIGTVYLRARYEVTERLWNFLRILAAVSAVALAVAVWVSYWLQSVVTRPILAITDVARRVREGRDYSLRASRTTEDEIGYLVDSFNEMLAEVARRAEELRTADRLKDEFLATLAHELRNPLAPLRNSLEILRMAPDNPAVLKQAREVMDRQLRQLVRLVDDLLDVSRITTGKLALKREPVDLASVVERALETARPLLDAREQALAVDLPREPVPLHADTTRLAQVFINLLNNASKFSGRGTSIGFTAALAPGEVAVTVSDQGIGIAPDMLPEVFKMFVQADRSLEREHAGLGVGLSLARHLVELHGGSISAQSEGRGRGSRFTVRLPVAPAPERAGAEPGNGGHDRARSGVKRILLADDNEDFAAGMATMLRALGHEVRVTNDGEEALAAAQAFRPEFAFLDIGLPKLNGYDLARRLRAEAETRQAILVAVTGWGTEEDKRKAREAGFDQHMVKPVELDQVRSVLERSPA